MTTSIGQRLREFPEGLLVMTAMAVAVIVIDFSGWHQFRNTFQSLDVASDSLTNALHTRDTVSIDRAYQRYAQEHKRHCRTGKEAYFTGMALAVLVLVLYPVFANGRLSSVGLAFSPDQGWRCWCLIAPIAALVSAGLAVPAGAFWLWTGGQLDDILDPNGDPEGHAMNLAFGSPFSEELIFRMAICTPVAASLGPRTAIAVSGILFALLHVVYGNPNPVNLVAGFVLAWAFLKSNTILVPMILHSLGNLLGWFILVECIVPLLRR